MNMTKLKSFLVLSESNSFTEAAEKLYCSQPAVSKHIQSLERELGVPLFNRTGNKTYLTIQGEYFKSYAEEIIAIYENSKEHIKQIENLEEGSLHFGATNFIGVYLMPQLIRKFQNIFPNIKINMTINSSKNIINKLNKNQLEFVFLSDYIEIDKSKYKSKLFLEDELALIVSKDHSLSTKDYCNLEDIKDEPFIMKSTNSSIYNFLQSKFKPHNFAIKRDLLISNQEGIKQAVINKLGISIMSKSAVETEVNAGLIHTVKIKNLPLTRNINYVYSKNRHMTPAAKEFLKII